jgi:hypothetical protein
VHIGVLGRSGAAICKSALKNQAFSKPELDPQSPGHGVAEMNQLRECINGARSGTYWL